VECEEYRARVFTHRWRTGSDGEPSDQADEDALDTLSLLTLLHTQTKNRGKRNTSHINGEEFIAEDEGWGKGWNKEGARQGISQLLCG
jgi:hypothetical protein